MSNTLHKAGLIMIKKLSTVLFTLGICMSAQAGEYILDVRSLPEVNQTGKVEGALVDDYYSPDFLQKFKSFNIKPDDTVLVYCRSGRRAEAVKDILEKNGYRNVKNLGGYEDAAKTLNKPLVK